MATLSSNFSRAAAVASAVAVTALLGASVADAAGRHHRAPARPDLVVQSIAAQPSSVVLAGSVKVSWKVKNTGRAGAAASTIRFYAARGRKRAIGDVRLPATAKVKALRRGKSRSGTVTQSLPALLPAGSYFLIGCTDDARRVRESDERNNCRATGSRFTITAAGGGGAPGNGGPGDNTQPGPGDNTQPGAGDNTQPGSGGDTTQPAAGGDQQPAIPTVSIGGVTAAEGNSGTTAFTFPVSLSQASAQSVTVHWATADGTATAPSDYAAASGDLSFAPGETAKSATVQVVGDTDVEPDEAFSVTLSSPVNATLAGGPATGTITNDDAVVLSDLSLDPTTIGPGESSTATVTLSGPAPAGGVVVTLMSSDTSAATVPASVTVPSGQTSVDFTAAGLTHADVTISATLGSVTVDRTLHVSSPPTVSIAGVTAVEGNGATTAFTFPVSLSKASAQTVTVHWATADGTATAPSDYGAASGDLSFAPGETAKSATVQVVGDTAFEPDEAFSVTLSSPVNATLAGGPATGTITNDDAVALSDLSLDPTIVSPGDTSTGTVTLSGPAPAGGLTVSLSSSGPAATVPASVTVPSGQTSADFTATGVSDGDVTISATLGTTTLNRGLQVSSAPAELAGLALDPTTIAPGGTSTGTVTLSRPAPPGGVVVDLSSSGSGATVPTTVTVPIHKSSATFTATGVSVSNDVITASLGATTSNAVLHVTDGTIDHAVLNEVDYDQPGTDTGEFVEIYNPTASPIDLSHLALVLVNGADNQEYRRTALSGTLAPNGYLVVADPGVTVPAGVPVIRYSGSQDNIQDGAPDGVALVDTSTETLVDALSYEGSITQAQITNFAGPVSLVEGTALATGTADSNTTVGSLDREPNGSDSDDSQNDWHFDTTPTPGTDNAGG